MKTLSTGTMRTCMTWAVSAWATRESSATACCSPTTPDWLASCSRRVRVHDELAHLVHQQVEPVGLDAHRLGLLLLAGAGVGPALRRGGLLLGDGLLGGRLRHDGRGGDRRGSCRRRGLGALLGGLRGGAGADALDRADRLDDRVGLARRWRPTGAACGRRCRRARWRRRTGRRARRRRSPRRGAARGRRARRACRRRRRGRRPTRTTCSPEAAARATASAGGPSSDGAAASAIGGAVQRGQARHELRPDRSPPGRRTRSRRSSARGRRGRRTGCRARRARARRPASSCPPSRSPSRA